MGTEQGRPRFDPERRQRILEAAADLIAERGLHAVRVSDIATRIGTTNGTVHYYFPTKDDVLDSAMTWAVERAVERQGADLRAIDGAYDRLVRLTDLQLPTSAQVVQEWSIWLQYWTEASLSAALRPAHADYYSRWQAMVQAIVERGQRRAEFRDVDPNMFTEQFSCLFNGAGTQVLAGTMSPERMREVVIGFIDTNLVTP